MTRSGEQAAIRHFVDRMLARNLTGQDSLCDQVRVQAFWCSAEKTCRHVDVRKMTVSFLKLYLIVTRKMFRNEPAYDTRRSPYDNIVRARSK